MEAPEIWYDVREAIGRKSRELRYWLTPSIDREEYPILPPRVKVWAAVGWVLIVLGVIGEGVSEGFVHKYDTALQILNDQIVSDARTKAANADLEAGQAKERAAKLEASMMLRRLSKSQGDALCSVSTKFFSPVWWAMILIRASAARAATSNSQSLQVQS